MEGKRAFIYEVSNHQRLKILFIVLLVVIAIAALVITFSATISEVIDSSAPYQAVKSMVTEDIKSFSPLGIFYFSLGGHLFFIPSPQEAFFIISLTKGNSALWVFFFMLAGAIPAQAINYKIGTRLNKPVMQFLSKKKIYKVKRMVNKRGGWAVFLCNVIPFMPAPLLTFTLGIAKYNLTRLFFYLILGAALKYAGLIYLYSVSGPSLENFLMRFDFLT